MCVACCLFVVVGDSAGLSRVTLVVRRSVAANYDDGDAFTDIWI